MRNKLAKTKEASNVIHSDATALVGNSPLVELSRLSHDLPGRVIAKLEMRNPAGSVKDRLGLALIDDAERRGVLKPGGTVIEATGGNTGIGLAFVAAIRGYRLILTMPDAMSKERVALLRQYGAEVILTSGILMTDALVRAKELTWTIPGSVYVDQFRNPANPDLHRRTTGPEMWDDTSGAIIPEVLNRAVIDEVIAVTDDEASDAARRLAQEESILAGVKIERDSRPTANRKTGSP